MVVEEPRFLNCREERSAYNLLLKYASHFFVPFGFSIVDFDVPFTFAWRVFASARFTEVLGLPETDSKRQRTKRAKEAA